MSNHDSDPPVADDGFPEFAQPPRHRPADADVSNEPRRDRRTPRPPAVEARRAVEAAAIGDDAQARADEIFARLRRERQQGKR